MYSAAFEEIRDRCVLCEKCELSKSREHTLFGCGSENARLLFVFDSAKEKDGVKGIPFSSESGRILDNFFTLMSLDKRKDVFITPIVKCAALKGSAPTQQQMEECMPYLRDQVRHIKPNIIVCLGEAAAKKMIDAAFSLKANHGRFIKKGKLYFMGTYSPYELGSDVDKRLAFLEDMQGLREIVDRELR